MAVWGLDEPDEATEVMNWRKNFFTRIHGQDFATVHDGHLVAEFLAASM